MNEIMRIKTILIPILASLALSSCIREVLPEEFAVAGLWAKVDDHSFAKQMVDIHDGIFHERDLMGDAKYVFEDAVWGCTEYSLSTGKKRDYSIVGNVLTIGDASYVLRREGDILCIGESRYKKYSIYEKQGYSEIVLENERASVPYTGADVDVAVEVLRRLPDAELTATTSHTWIKNLRIEGGHLRFTAEPSTERRTATVYLRCPGAIEQVFTIIQEKPGY